MVRPGFTNVFQTKTAEDLENKIVYVLSEQVAQYSTNVGWRSSLNILKQFDFYD